LERAAAVAHDVLQSAEQALEDARHSVAVARRDAADRDKELAAARAAMAALERK
jgi:hypothetical protein